jgi:hypothetical protein
LARYALPLAILVNPGVSNTTGAHNCSSFLFYLILIYPGSNGNIPVQVNRHPSVAKLLILIDSVSDMSQSLALVHKVSIIVCEVKCLRKQHTQSPRIMSDFYLIPGILERQNSRGFVSSHTSMLGCDFQTHPRQ